MYRSASTSRFSGDNFSYYSSAKVPMAKRALSPYSSELPVYEPMSDAGKKDKSRAKFAENAVHLIPVVLLFCAFVLWLFSDPDIDIRGNSMEAEMLRGTIGGGLDSDGTGHLPLHLGHMDHADLREAKTLFF